MVYEIPDEFIKEIIRAGTYAPTAMNQQPWRFVVVKSRRLIEGYTKLVLASVRK
jgi:nitroreductase